MTRAPRNHGRVEMRRAVWLRQERRRRHAEQGERPLWHTLSLAGSLGWLIVLPILAGTFAGRWLDARLDTGITLTGALIVVGAVVGGALAWRRMHQP